MKVLRSICTIFASMKARNILILILGTLILPFYLTSCGVDRWKEYAGRTQTDRWIDDTMRVWYYWADEIPHTNQLNYFQPPFNFFASIRSKEDKFSTIDSLTSSAATRSIPYTDHSYGFQFTVNRVEVEGEENAFFAHILYVAEGSPASEIGLKRGDWIIQMDGKFINEQSVTKLYGSDAMQLTVGYYDAKREAIVPYGQPRQIAAARPIDDNPVHYKNVYTRGSKKIGYLVYNHFSSGLTNSSHEYDDDLRDAFHYFSSQQVNEFILDLRYNNGGLLSCAELMCAMLAPSSALGQELGYLEYNNYHDPQTVSFTLAPGLIGHGANLNLKTLYVLTSSQTASASEMVINCLAPYMDVIVIGGTTVGKNLGSVNFSSSELMITMNPIVCKIYNSEGESDYESGFRPTLSEYMVNETSNLARFLPFGDTDEALLST
ncbi:MAG: peptidase S41, partial [Bacteroides sp.]|nr:peptidase S41 [Bacteroides sp.]